MSLRKDALKNRVIAKKKRLEARIAELKADTQGKTADELDRVKAKLRDLEGMLKNGWNGITDKTAKSLQDWLGK